MRSCICVYIHIYINGLLFSYKKNEIVIFSNMNGTVRNYIKLSKPGTERKIH